MRAAPKASVAAAILAWCGALEAARAVERFDPPATSDAMAPFLAAAAGGGAAAIWIEPPADGAGASRIRFARFSGEGWASAATVAESAALFANWADTPGLVASGNGDWLAWWLEKLGAGTYAYGIRLARSNDGGATWSALGWLQDDLSEGEHGFVSAVAEGSGARFFWLDGRGAGGGHGAGAMQLRTALVGAEVTPSALVDERVCDCCPTAAARGSDGALVAFRDRSADEIRDIRLARVAAGDRATAAGTVAVGADGWKIEGCPVNGPALVADAGAVAVAWFTGAQERARVAVATSRDGGATFGSPFAIDEQGPLGRVALTPLGAGESALAWLARAGERAELRVARVDRDGRPGPALALGATAAGRKSGVPRLARLGDGRLLALWTEAGDAPTALRAARLAPAELTAP
jgi:hypothetical protein